MSSAPGSSNHTPRKQEQLAAIMRMWLSVAPRVSRRTQLRIVDCSAGDGTGSPRVILNAAAEVNAPPFKFVCIERDPRTYAKLVDALGDRAQLEPGDCVDVLPQLPGRYDPELYYYDPNGADFAPITVLRQVCRWRSDVLLHVSATTAKRNDTERLDSALDRLGKRHAAIWVDQTPDHLTAWQWSFVIATNWANLLTKFKGHQNFHDCATAEGRYWLDVVSTTIAERRDRDEPQLPF